MFTVFQKNATARLALFFVLSFAIAWGAWIPSVLAARSGGSGTVPLAFIGLFAPAIAGLIVAMLRGGLPGAEAVLSRYGRWRFGLGWYGLSVLLLPALFTIVALVNGLLLLHSASVIWLGSPWYFVAAAFVWLMVINSGEEIGWRGYALPEMLALKASPLGASLLLGFIWGLWHLPLYLVPGQSSFPYVLFLPMTMGLSIVYTIVFLRTGGSLLAAVLLHAGTDIAPRFLRIADFTWQAWLLLDILVWIAALALAARAGWLRSARAEALPSP